MGVFHHEEAPNPSKKCKFLAATLKDVFPNCSTCGGRISTSSPEEEYPTADVDDEQEVLTFQPPSQKKRKRIENHVLSFYPC